MVIQRLLGRAYWVGMEVGLLGPMEKLLMFFIMLHLLNHMVVPKVPEEAMEGGLDKVEHPTEEEDTMVVVAAVIRMRCKMTFMTKTKIICILVIKRFKVVAVVVRLIWTLRWQIAVRRLGCDLDTDW
jgi:hypothetical protein